MDRCDAMRCLPERRATSPAWEGRKGSESEEVLPVAARFGFGIEEEEEEERGELGKVLIRRVTAEREPRE